MINRHKTAAFCFFVLVVAGCEQQDGDNSETVRIVRQPNAHDCRNVGFECGFGFECRDDYVCRESRTPSEPDNRQANVNADGDGYTRERGDCDDGNSDIFPGAREVCDNRENDCDGRTDLEDANLDRSTAALLYQSFVDEQAESSSEALIQAVTEG